MEWYKIGEPVGRYIGSSGKYHVYSETISETPPVMSGMRKPHEKSPEEISLMYGPATGGLMESGAVRIITPGELVRMSTVFSDYKKRTMSMTGKKVEDALLLVERINGFHSASHSIAYLSAVEDAAGMDVDDAVLRKRMAILEMERIRSNLEVVKRMLEAGGLGVPVNQVGYLRERVSRIISKSAGHRFFFSVNGLNSASVDLSKAAVALNEIVEEFSHIFEGLQESKIFLNRMQTTGIVKGIPMVGPAARASGMNADARADSRTLPYGDTVFEPVIRTESDSFGRFMVRSEEILMASRILDDIGNVGNGSDLRNYELSGSGEGAGRVESPAGDLFYHVKLNEGRIENISMVSPSRLNITAFEQSYPGNLVTDFHLNWEGFGIWFAEAGVEFI